MKHVNALRQLASMDPVASAGTSGRPGNERDTSPTRPRLARRQRASQAGVALVSVLFIGAVMTVTVSAAAFIAVQEFRAANHDRGATSALALSEAGVDRSMQWIRSNKTTWRNIVLSGCGTKGSIEGVSYETITLNGQIGSGTYSTTITRADGCSPLPAQVPSPRVPQQLILESTGCTNNTVGMVCPTGASKRVVRQAVTVSSRPLPIGVSTNRIDARGSPTFRNMVVFARGIVNTRRQITMTGADPYYKKSDFYPCTGGLTEAQGHCFDVASSNDAPMPASIHSTDRIFLNPNGTSEHPPNPNCTSAQYTWDGSATGSDYAAAGESAAVGCLPYPNRPPSTLFTDADYDRLARDPRLSEEDHLYFKQIAQQSGLYCADYGSSSQKCTKAGAPATVSGDLDNPDVAGIGNFYTVYIEYPDGTDPQRNMVNWSVTTPAPNAPCNSTAPATTMAVVIVRNGGFTTKQNFMGALFAEDGHYETGDNVAFEGTIAAQSIRTRGGPTVCNSQRWVDSMPGIYLQVTPLQWSEVDR